MWPLTEFRESGFWSDKNIWQQEPRNRDMRFRDLIAAVKSSLDLDRRCDLSRSFRDREFKRERTQCNKNPDFAICEIVIESGPLDQEMIWTVDLISHGVSGIGICKWQKLWTSGIPILRWVNSRLNLNRQIWSWSGSLIWPLYGILWIGICKYIEYKECRNPI